MTGSVTRQNARHGVAPWITAASSSRVSKPLKDGRYRANDIGGRDENVPDRQAEQRSLPVKPRKVANEVEQLQKRNTCNDRWDLQGCAEDGGEKRLAGNVAAHEAEGCGNAQQTGKNRGYRGEPETEAKRLDLGFRDLEIPV